jgi:hypothetical protein
MKTKGIKEVKVIKGATEIEEGGSVIMPPLLPLVLLLPLLPLLF